MRRKRTLARITLPAAALAVLAGLAPAGRQVITVTAASRTATYRRFVPPRSRAPSELKSSAPWTARVGYNGIAAPSRKREGDGRTPSGTYGFGFFFDVDPNPGVAHPYRHAYSVDYWDDDPKSSCYNEWADTAAASPGRYPEPMRNVPAYDYTAVIAYNTARTPGLGSAILLQVGTGAATAGCVSLPANELLEVLRWLRPAVSPRITVSAR